MKRNPSQKDTTYEYTTFPLQFVSYKWFKPLLVGALVAVLSLVFQADVWLVGVALLGDMETAREAVNRSSEHFFTGPGAFMAIGGIAITLPALAIAARIVRDRPFSSYSSSRGGWNWGVFGRSLALATVVFFLTTFGQALFFPEEGADGVIRFTVLGAVLCAVLVPIQAAAEEYLYRGLIMQTIGSWTRLPMVAVALSAIVFAVSHSYGVLGITSVFVHGLGFALLTWYTKGLEASSSAHIANNLAVFFCDGLGLVSNRDGGIDSLVIAVGMMVVYCAAVVLLDKKFGWFSCDTDPKPSLWSAKSAKG